MLTITNQQIVYLPCLILIYALPLNNFFLSFHPLSRAALDKADILLNMKHGIVRLDNVWGTGGGLRPVKFLVKQVSLPHFFCFLQPLAPYFGFSFIISNCDYIDLCNLFYLFYYR